MRNGEYVAAVHAGVKVVVSPDGAGTAATGAAAAAATVQEVATGTRGRQLVFASSFLLLLLTFQSHPGQFIDCFFASSLFFSLSLFLSYYAYNNNILLKSKTNEMIINSSEQAS